MRQEVLQKCSCCVQTATLPLHASCLKCCIVGWSKIKRTSGKGSWLSRRGQQGPAYSDLLAPSAPRSALTWGPFVAAAIINNLLPKADLFMLSCCAHVVAPSNRCADRVSNQSFLTSTVLPCLNVSLCEAAYAALWMQQLVLTYEAGSVDCKLCSAHPPPPPPAPLGLKVPSPKQHQHAQITPLARCLCSTVQIQPRS